MSSFLVAMFDIIAWALVHKFIATAFYMAGLLVLRLKEDTLSSALQCSAVLCCAVLCCAVLCCAVLCCAVLLHKLAEICDVDAWQAQSCEFQQLISKGRAGRKGLSKTQFEGS